MLFNIIERLPNHIVGYSILSYLGLCDIVRLERARGSKESHQLFLDQISYRPSILIPSTKFPDISLLEWFGNRRCKLKSLSVLFHFNSSAFHLKNLEVEELYLHLESNITIEDCKIFLERNLGYLVKTITISENPNNVIMEQLSACTENVNTLNIVCADNNNNWLTADVISKWKLKEVLISSSTATISLITLIVQTCTELTCIKLYGCTVDDDVVMVVAQHCPKLETLTLSDDPIITYKSLIALSERELPLNELNIDIIPNIPTADIAKRCSHALSCIRNMMVDYLHQFDQDANILIPYMTEVTCVTFSLCGHLYIPLLTQYCHKLTSIGSSYRNGHIDDIMSLCGTNPLLQVLIFCSWGFTDTILIELIHTCPHLHTLRLPDEDTITDIGILALSEHCPQLQCLEIGRCRKVTEAVILQLLQRCRTLTRLEISRSSLSEETWKQLDKNTQKRVIRW